MRERILGGRELTIRKGTAGLDGTSRQEVPRETITEPRHSIRVGQRGPSSPPLLRGGPLPPSRRSDTRRPTASPRLGRPGGPRPPPPGARPPPPRRGGGGGPPGGGGGGGPPGSPKRVVVGGLRVSARSVGGRGPPRSLPRGDELRRVCRIWQMKLAARSSPPDLATYTLCTLPP
jgi:hypothetical protein